MAKPSSYWDKRAIKNLSDAEKQSEAYIARINKMYDQAQRNIQRDLENIYANYSKATGMDVQSLKTLLTKSETDKLWKELKAKGLDQYVKGNYKARISRLEKLQAQVYAKAKELYPQEQQAHTELYKGVVNGSYYKTIYDVQMGTGLDFAFSKIDDNMMNALLNEKWSGKNYSQRIWGNTDLLAESLSEIIGGAMMSGQSLAKTSRQLRERFDVSKYYADRLVRTETNHFNNEADAMAYEEMDVDKYVFLATLDTRTSSICQEMDGKVIPLKDREVGKNYPPLHPNCRSKTRVYMGEEIEATLKRRARNPKTGKTEIVGNISYKEWAKQNGLDQPNVPKAKKTTPKTPKKDDFKEITDAIDFQYGNYTDKDFYDWEDHYNDLNKGVKLSDEEQENIERYTEGGHIGMNGVSRNDTDALRKLQYTDEDIKRANENADALEKTLSKYDLDTDIVTHRFERDVSWLTGGGNGVEELEKLVGTEYKTDGFTSSGMYANRSRFTGGKTDAVHFEIVTPKGTNGAYLSMSKKGETEFLYNRNTRYKVLDGGERIVKERKYNFSTGQFDDVDVKERFLKVQVIPEETPTKAVAKTAEKAVEKPVKKPVKKVAEEVKTPRNNVKIDVSDLPEPMKSKKELENSQILCDYINGQTDADPKVAKMYKLSGKMADGNPYKISHAKSKGNGLTYYPDDYSDVTLNVPKLNGTDDIGKVNTVLHENAHLIDFMVGSTEPTHFASSANGKLFKTVATTDDKIGDKVGKLFDAYNKEFDDVEHTLNKKYSNLRNEIGEKYLNGEIPYKEYTKLLDKSRAEERAELETVTRNLMGGGVNNLQDIYDALSGGMYYNNRTVRYGHGTHCYMFDNSARVREIKAQYSTLSISRPDLIELLKEDKPALVEALDELVDEIIKRYGG